MDHIVVLSDIHANLAALESVLADMDARGFSNRYCLGDLVGYGTFANEVIATLRDHKIPTLMGNYDQGIGASSDDCGCAYTTDEARAMGTRSVSWTNQHITAENRECLRHLPPRISLQVGKFRVLLVHGSPRKINEYLFQDRPDRSLERMMDAVDADVLVCGHTHIPYHRILPSGRVLVNDGSVGKPKDGDPRAGYIVLDGSGQELGVEFIRVAYDVERTAQAIEATGMPDEYATMLRTGTG